MAVDLWVVMPHLVSNPEAGMFFLLLPGLFIAAVGLYVFLDAVNLFGGAGPDAPAQVTLIADLLNVSVVREDAF